MRIISLDEKQVAEIPNNLNGDSFLKIIEIYLFNKEFQWKEFKIEKVE